MLLKPNICMPCWRFFLIGGRAHCRVLLYIHNYDKICPFQSYQVYILMKFPAPSGPCLHAQEENQILRGKGEEDASNCLGNFIPTPPPPHFPKSIPHLLFLFFFFPFGFAFLTFFLSFPRFFVFWSSPILPTRNKGNDS